MMSMVFYASSRVTLLFDFWNVHEPGGMLLSVFVVMLLTVFYELFKAWRVWLDTKSKLAPPALESTLPPAVTSDSSTVLEGSQSELSLTPDGRPAVSVRNSWVLHVTQTFLQVVQVTLGYMLMLCVMSFNAWIFLAVIAGSGLGYFISFLLFNRG